VDTRASQRSAYADSGDVCVVEGVGTICDAAGGLLAQLVKETNGGQKLLKRLTVNTDWLAHPSPLNHEVDEDCDKGRRGAAKTRLKTVTWICFVRVRVACEQRVPPAPAQFSYLPFGYLSSLRG
jgi:hypothetical protein